MEDTAITRRDSGGSYKTYTWRSKTFKTSRPACMKVGKVKLTVGNGVSEGQQQAALDAASTSIQDDIDNGLITEFGEFGGSTPATYPVAGDSYLVSANDITGSTITAVLRVFADGVLYATKLLADSRPFRLPVIEQKLSDTWEVEISGTDIQVHEVTLAETMSELREV